MTTKKVFKRDMTDQDQDNSGPEIIINPPYAFRNNSNKMRCTLKSCKISYSKRGTGEHLDKHRTIAKGFVIRYDDSGKISPVERFLDSHYIDNNGFVLVKKNKKEDEAKGLLLICYTNNCFKTCHFKDGVFTYSNEDPVHHHPRPIVWLNKPIPGEEARGAGHFAHLKGDERHLRSLLGGKIVVRECAAVPQQLHSKGAGQEKHKVERSTARKLEKNQQELANNPSRMSAKSGAQIQESHPETEPKTSTANPGIRTLEKKSVSTQLNLGKVAQSGRIQDMADQPTEAQPKKKDVGSRRAETSGHSHASHCSSFAPPPVAQPKPSANVVFGTGRFGEPGPSRPLVTASSSRGMLRPPAASSRGGGHAKAGLSGDGPRRVPGAPDVIISPETSLEETDEDELSEETGDGQDAPEHQEGAGSPPVQVNSPATETASPQSDNAVGLLDLSESSDDLKPSPNKLELPYDFDPVRKIKYAKGTQKQFEQMDFAVTNEEMTETVQYTGLPVQMQIHWLLLTSLMMCYLGSNGFAVLVRQLCQWCLKPAFCRVGCGHTGLCADCGGGEDNPCIQCEAIKGRTEKKLLAKYLEGKQKIAAVPGIGYFLVGQWFFTATEEDAKVLLQVIESICQGPMTSEQWRAQVEDKMNHFNQGSLKKLAKLNPTLKNVPLEYVDQMKCLVVCTLVSRTELKCQTCHLHGRQPRTRVILRECMHCLSCYKCIKENDDICTQEECRGRMEKGQTPVSHTVLSRAAE